MKLSSLILLSLFALSSVVHLYFCYKGNEKCRRYSKPFCLLFLAITAVVQCPNQPLIYIGAFLSLAGDIFMIWKSKTKLLVLGALFFMGAHGCYIAEIVTLLPYKFEMYWIPIFIGIYFFFVGVMYVFVKKVYNYKLKLPAAIYYSFICVAITLSIFLCTAPGIKIIYGILLIFGYLSFFLSDNLIYLYLKYKESRKKDLYIMVTYLIAEVSIVVALLMLSL